MRFWILLVIGCGAGESPSDQLFRGDVWGGNLAVDHGIAYWTTYDEGGSGPNEIGLYAAPLDSSKPPVRLSVGNSHGVPGFGMVVAGGRAFWSGQIGSGADGAAVFGDSITGGERTQVAQFSTDQAPAGVDADDQFVYAQGTELLRIPLDGSAPQMIGGAGDWLVHVDTELIVDRGGVIHRISLPGLVDDTLATVTGVSGHFVVDGNTIYVPTGSGIVKIARDTAVTSTLQAGGSVVDIAVAGDVVFAAVDDSDGRDLVRLSASGGPTTLVLANPFAVGTMVIAGSELVFASCSCGPVGGANGTIEHIAF